MSVNVKLFSSDKVVVILGDKVDVKLSCCTIHLIYTKLIPRFTLNIIYIFSFFIKS